MSKTIDTPQVSEAAENLTPYKGVQMLLQGALAKVSSARTAIQEGNIEERGAAVGDIMTILGVLQSSLDRDLGGEIAENLDALYDYMNRKLSSVAFDKTSRPLDGVETVLLQIKQAWDGIEAETGVVA